MNMTQQMTQPTPSRPSAGDESCAGAILLMWRQDEPHALLIRPRGKYELPKGHIEAGETVAEAALRELREETTLRSQAHAVGFAGKVRYAPDARRPGHFKEVTYLVARCVEAPVFSARKRDGHIKRRWVCAADLAEVTLISEALRPIVARVLEQAHLWQRVSLLDAKIRKKRSKFLSLVLRHRPDCIGLSLDDSGWVDIDALLVAMRKHGKRLTHAELHQVVAQCDKQRFAFSADGVRIRASQGHSIPVSLGYVTQAPPARLYHGTSRQYVDLIMKGGLRKMNRHHVHLSTDLDTATRVGARRGKPVIFIVDCEAMQRDGHLFHCSSNGVWLVDAVAPKYLSVAWTA